VRVWELVVRLVLGPPTIQPDAALGHGPVARASGRRWRPVMSVPNWAGGWSLVSQAAHVQQDQILIQVNNPCAEPCDGLTHPLHVRGVRLQRVEAKSLLGHRR
jgi:hypothetical protein